MMCGSWRKRSNSITVNLLSLVTLLSQGWPLVALVVLNIIVFGMAFLLMFFPVRRVMSLVFFSFRKMRPLRYMLISTVMIISMTFRLLLTIASFRVLFTCFHFGTVLMMSLPWIILPCIMAIHFLSTHGIRGRNMQSIRCTVHSMAVHHVIIKGWHFATGIPWKGFLLLERSISRLFGSLVLRYQCRSYFGVLKSSCWPALMVLPRIFSRRPLIVPNTKGENWLNIPCRCYMKQTVPFLCIFN